MRATLLAVILLLCAAVPAQAGQVVFSRDSGELRELWVMDDSGGNARLLVDNVALGMTELREPAASADGRTVAFTGTTPRNAGTFDGQFHYGINATGLYLWRSGKVRRVTGAPAQCAGCSSFETTPSITPGGGTVTAETFFSTASVGNFGRLLVRPPGGGEAQQFATACEETAVGDPAAAPRGNAVAYVGCDANVLVSGPGRAGEHPAHFVAARGDFAPETRSPAWSPDGSRLAAIDRPGDETTEVWTFGADGSDPRLVLTAPKGVGIRTVTYMGPSRLLFDVAYDNGTDLWTAPTSCAACAFPAGVKRLTNNGMSHDPAWTPGTIGGAPTVKALKAKRALKLRLTLPRAATVKFTVRGFGTVRRKVKAGTHTVRIAKGIARGRYRVTVRVPGFKARKITARAR